MLALLLAGWMPSAGLTLCDAVGSADLTLRDAVGSADLTLCDAVGSADLTLREAVGSADLTLCDAVGSADLTLCDAVGSADLTLCDAVGSADLPLREAVGSADLTLRDAVRSADLTLRDAVRSADLAGIARVAELKSFAVENGMGARVAVSRSKKGARLARLEFGEVWKGALPQQPIWMLAEPDYAGYSLNLEAPGASVLVFLSRGDSTDPLQQQYLEQTDWVLWRAVGLGSVFCAVEGDELRTPALRFEPEDGPLAELETGSDGRARRIGLATLKQRVRALCESQRKPWLRVRAGKRRGEFAWRMELCQDRSYTLFVDRAAGEERIEHLISAACAREIEAQLEKAQGLELGQQYGTEHAGQLVREVEWIGVRKFTLATLDFQDFRDPDYAQSARWALTLYGLTRSGISEPGLLDGRSEDRKFLR